MKHLTFTPAFNPLHLSLIASATAILIACGGGGGSGTTAATTATTTTNTTSTSSGTTAGTITGFGSVFVDGTEIEDAQATTRRENADGSYTNVALKLGQQVRVATDGATSASVITVGAAVMGAVNTLSASTNEFKAAGQWIKVNTDATAGPVTVYGGGYTALADITAADLVEVHGNAVYSSARAAYVIQATRVEKMTAISAVRVTGKIASLNTTAKTFALNGITVNYTSATLAPTDATLANDQVVVVWGPSGSLTGGSSLTLNASRLRVTTNAAAASITSGTGQIGGLVTAYSTTAKTFEIDGITVSLVNGTTTATITPTGASVANGGYVQVNGTFGTGGVLAASTVRVRQQDTATATAAIRLNGTISNYVDSASFLVRGVPVDASAITLTTACPGVTLANGLVVEVSASQQPGTDVVKATAMSCRSPSATSATQVMRDLQGTAGTVDATAKTFVVTRADATTQKALWTDQTAWGTGVTSANLSTTKVVVEGYLNTSSVLVARSIRIQGTADVDKYITPTPSTSAGTTTTTTTPGWDDYNNKFRPGRK
jgi:Domain of unknown function (DUF5666)